MEVKLPKIGDSGDGGTVVSILVKAGDVIAAGDTILEVENEKAVAPIPSPAAGRIARIDAVEGKKLSVGSTILVLEPAGAAPSQPPPPAPGALPKSAAPRPAAEAPVQAPPPPQAQEEVIVDEDLAAETGPVPPASPYVRRVAMDLGIALSRVKSSRPDGRVAIEDLARFVADLRKAAVRARAASKPAPPPAAGLPFPPVNQDFSRFGPVTEEPLSQTRRWIAQRMVENAVSLPHVTQFDEVDVSALEAHRARHNAAVGPSGVKLSPTPYFIRALVATLRKHPHLNASLNDATQTLVVKQYFHIGIAVDTDSGLVVPVLRDADRKSLEELAAELRALALRARERKLQADEMKGGTFTISNQGAIGGGHFTPIINKPEVAILGIGRTAPKPVAVEGQRVEVRPVTALSLSYDHRVVDGGTAARFMTDLVASLHACGQDIVGKP